MAEAATSDQAIARANPARLLQQHWRATAPVDEIARANFWVKLNGEGGANRKCLVLWAAAAEPQGAIFQFTLPVSGNGPHHQLE
jgi:hypothetical protein